MLPEDTFGLHGEDEKIDDSNRIIPEKEENVTKAPVSKDNPFNMNESSQTSVNSTKTDTQGISASDIIDLEELSNNIVNNQNNVNQTS